LPSFSGLSGHQFFQWLLFPEFHHPSRRRKAFAGIGIANGIVCGICSPMTATITVDKAGRCVLPKRIRERMHLREGARLRLELTGDTLELTPVAAEARLEKIGKRRVVVGWDGFDAAKAVKAAREEYLERLEDPSHQ